MFEPEKLVGKTIKEILKVESNEVIQFNFTDGTSLRIVALKPIDFQQSD